MSWSDAEDLYEDEKPYRSQRKPRQHFNHDDNGDGHRKKHSGKQSHRRRTHEDDFWEENQR